MCILSILRNCRQCLLCSRSTYHISLSVRLLIAIDLLLRCFSRVLCCYLAHLAGQRIPYAHTRLLIYPLIVLSTWLLAYYLLLTLLLDTSLAFSGVTFTQVVISWSTAATAVAHFPTRDHASSSPQPHTQYITVLSSRCYKAVPYSCVLLSSIRIAQQCPGGEVLHFCCSEHHSRGIGPDLMLSYSCLPVYCVQYTTPMLLCSILTAASRRHYMSSCEIYHSLRLP